MRQMSAKQWRLVEAYIV